MAGEAIRRAVIMLGVQQERSSVQAPDTSQMTRALEEERRAIEGVRESLTRAAEAAEKFFTAQEKGRQSTSAPQKTPEEEALEKNLERIRRNSEYQRQAAEQEQKIRETLRADLAAEEEARDSAAQAAEEAAERQVAAQMDVLRHYQGLTQGAIRYARGVAFLVAADEESAQAMLKVIAVGQGVFDIYKGAVQITRHYNALLEAQAAASAVAATAESTRAGAHTASATAAAASTVATGGLTIAVNALTASLVALALNPVVLALTAIVLAIYGTVKAFDALTTSEEEAKENARQLADYNQKLADSFRARAAADEAVRQAGVSSLEFYDDLTEKSQVAEEALKKEREALAMLQEERALYDRAPIDNPQLRAAGLEAEIDAQQRILELARAQKDIAREEADQKQRAVDEEIRAIEAAEKRLDLAQKNLDTIQEAIQASQTEIGAASRADQSRLARIQAKVDQGGAQSLSGRELEFAGRFSVSREFAQQEQARRVANQEASFAATFQPNRSQELRQAQVEQGSAQQGLNQLTGGATVEDAIAKLRQQRDQATTELEATYRTINEWARKVNTAVGSLSAELEQARHAAEAQRQ